MEEDSGIVTGRPGVYVDDLLLSGSQKVVDAMIEAFQRKWETLKTRQLNFVAWKFRGAKMGR